MNEFVFLLFHSHNLFLNMPIQPLRNPVPVT